MLTVASEIPLEPLSTGRGRRTSRRMPTLSALARCLDAGSTITDEVTEVSLSDFVLVVDHSETAFPLIRRR